MRKLREQRINVDNVDQYKFAHLVLLHCLVESNHEMRCTTQMVKNIRDIIASPNILSKQMRCVEDNGWQDKAIQSMRVKIQSVSEGKDIETVSGIHTKVTMSIVFVS